MQQSASANVARAVVVGVVRPEGVAYLSDSERAAEATFREFDMVAITDDDPPPAHFLLAYRDARRAWVATHEVDQRT